MSVLYISAALESKVQSGLHFIGASVFQFLFIYGFATFIESNRSQKVLENGVN